MLLQLYKCILSDTQPPVVDFCESPPEFITDTEDVDIEWDEPIFHDNSRETLSISQTHTFGRFKFGETDIVYIASDSSGNTAECKITVSLQSKSNISVRRTLKFYVACTGHPCTVPNDPINGHRNCTEDKHAVQCTLACEDGFAFAFRPTGDYFCEVSTLQDLSCFLSLKKGGRSWDVATTGECPSIPRLLRSCTVFCYQHSYRSHTQCGHSQGGRGGGNTV